MRGTGDGREPAGWPRRFDAACGLGTALFWWLLYSSLGLSPLAAVLLIGSLLASLAIGAALGSVALVATIIVAVVWVAIVVVVMTALNAVFQTALYLYATTGSLPAGFEGADLRATFGPR